MTRRAQVVRSSSRTGPGSYRDFSSTIIHCYVDTCANQWADWNTVASIPVEARDPFQRFFASATVDGVQAWWDDDTGDSAILALVVANGPELTWVKASRDQRVVALTGVVDLSNGFYNIELRMSPETSFNRCGYQGLTMQVIEGQVLSQPGCLGRSDPCS